ncbi:BQ5605_C027g10410 [Microbotryum silenes-dioicae]|uniref:Cyclin-dependent kinases regulatory subunit n=1 Tax=Microbotryum silenes-dioicae TaxID=796604 RepID=A0A2X0N9M7_9BASI|nr:BQ5605_C027g10410 [Microbotryum silenes-dioicae]
MSKASRTTADNPEQRRRDIEKYSEAIFYSARYSGSRIDRGLLNELSRGGARHAKSTRATINIVQQPPFCSYNPMQTSAGRVSVYGCSAITSLLIHHEQYEYRHVILPKALVKYLPTDRLAEEDEWRGLGIRQSPGWEHYMRHAPEPHILLFKREKDYQIKYPN